MPDKLQIEVTAAVSQALQGLHQTAEAVAKLKATTIAANTETAASHNVLGAAVANSILAFRTAPTAGAFMKDLGVISAGVAASVGTGLRGAVVSAGQSIKTHLVDGVKGAVQSLNSLDQVVLNVGASILKSFGPLIGLTAVAGVGIAIGAAVQQTMNWDDAIARLSHSLNGNVEEASKWIAVANFVGISESQLQVGFQRLSAAIINEKATLKDMGIAVVDANGHMRQMTDIISDLQRWFRAHKDTIEATNAAQALFGRGNAGMAALLGMSAQQMRVLTEEARALGEIVGGEQLAKWRSFDAEVKTAGFSVQALGLVLGHGLMPVFAVVAQGIAEFVSQHLNELVKGLASVAGFIVGLMTQLFGIKFNFSDFANAISGVSSRVAELGTVYDLTGNAAARSASGTKRATDAINDQIDALRSQNQLMQDQTDAAIAALEAQGQKEAYDRQQTQAKQKVADDQKAIEKLRSQYDQYLLLGDLANAQNVYEQMTQAQQQMADDQTALSDSIAAHDRQAVIDALRQKQKAHDDETNDLIKQLEKRSAAIARSAADSNAGLLRGSASTAKSFNDQWNSAGKTFADGMNAASIKAGKDMGESIQKAMAFILTLLDPSTDPKKVKAREAAWRQMGNAMGDAFGSGFMKAAARNIPVIGGIYVILEQMVAALPAAEQNIAKGYAKGGTVPGMIGAPQLAIVHGGEKIISVDQQRAESSQQQQRPQTAPIALLPTAPSPTPGAPATPQGGQLTMHNVFHITESSDPEKTARIVVRQLRQAMGRT